MDKHSKSPALDSHKQILSEEKARKKSHLTALVQEAYATKVTSSDIYGAALSVYTKKPKILSK